MKLGKMVSKRREKGRKAKRPGIAARRNKKHFRGEIPSAKIDPPKSQV